MKALLMMVTVLLSAGFASAQNTVSITLKED